GGERMRFKVMHKIHDHKKRFGNHQMCVGCGRCDDKCPVFISFSTTVNRLADEVDKINRGEK
ncbi:MAG: 4Fe-4S dicluster domain-containing protein, partial [Fusobacteriaceae bacterium]